MKWAQRFPKPIVLKDGRRLVSLVQARDFMSALPPSRVKNAHWVYAADRLFDAARTEDAELIGDAHAQLLRALAAEGLV